MISAAVLDALVAAGATAEMIAAVVKAAIADDESAITQRRRTDAERQKRHRMSRDITLVTRDKRDTLPPDKERSPGPPKEINSPPTPPSLRSGGASSRHEDTFEFLEFWTAYPHKIGKGDARKAWPRALEKAGSLAVILDGLQRYKRAKPPPPDGPPWCNPATFLNQERWADQPLYTNGKNDGEVLYKFSTVEEVMAEIESERKAAHGG